MGNLQVEWKTIEEALDHSVYKCEKTSYYDVVTQKNITSTEPKKHWLLVRFKGKVWFSNSERNSEEDEKLKKQMLEEIKRKIYGKQK